jgi:predicted secreted hydrolase
MSRTARKTGLAGILLGMLLAACGAATPGGESDFAVLARAADGFEMAEPGRRLEFPRDHGAHPGFRIEWWYLTVNLEDTAGAQYGAQWTLFRTATTPGDQPTAENAWQSGQVYMAHFALTWPQGHRAWQRYARGGDHAGLAQAGVRAEPFAAWLDDWELADDGQHGLVLNARQDDFFVELELVGNDRIVLQGIDGYSQKHPDGGGSHYYSQPFLEARGEIGLDGKRVSVQGNAWLDREWSSQFLQDDQQGWDWFALHLDSGEKMMLFRLRPRAGITSGAFVHGVLIGADGRKQNLDPDRLELNVSHHTTVAGRELPLRWSVSLPEIDRAFEIRALHPDQWMDLDFPYWEGVVLVSGDGPGNTGRGYMELTGYPGPDSRP